VSRFDYAVTIGAVWLAAFVVRRRHVLEAALRANEQQALALARREGCAVAVMIVDLDGFLGHLAGDQLLRAVAGRFGGVVRASDTLARLGGDEFAVVQRNPRGPEDAAVLAHALAGALAAPFALGEHQARVAASVGVALFPDDGTDLEELLKNADVALYRAKREGRGLVRFFGPATHREAGARRRLARELGAVGPLSP
jgi:diguanylate cyclase (GGDEF)-like protein